MAPPLSCLEGGTPKEASPTIVLLVTPENFSVGIVLGCVGGKLVTAGTNLCVWRN